MKVLLINPSMRFDNPRKLFPMGLGYIATAVNNAGFDLTIYDIDAHRFGDIEVERYIRNNKFDVIGYGCLVTNFRWVKKISSMIKEHHPYTKIMVGNTVSTSIPELLLESTKVDIAVVGEGDITVVEILKRLGKNEGLEGIDGIFYKEDGRIIKNNPREVIKDINSIPFPNRDIFDIERYMENSHHNVGEPLPLPREQIRSLNVSTTRGCTLKCTFCFHNFYGKRFRYRSAENIIGEVKELKQKYNVNYIQFWDDLSFFNKRQFEEFSDKLIESDLNIFWSANTMSGVLKKGDEEIVKKMKKSGCVIVGTSIESAHQPILDMMKKRITPEEFTETRKVIRSAGIAFVSSLVFGYPIETAETIKKTVDFCIQEEILPSSGYVLPLPGTEIYGYAKEKGLIRDEEDYLLKVEDRQDLHLNLTSMSNGELEHLVQQGVRRFQEAQGVFIEGPNPLKTLKDRAPQKSGIDKENKKAG